MRKNGRPAIYGLLIINLLLIFWGWWAGSHGLFASDLAGILLAFGRLSGLLAVFGVLLEFVLIGRPLWLEKVFGFDRLAHYHHWNGFFSLFFIVLHPLLLGFSYAMDNQLTFWQQMADFFQHYTFVDSATIAFFIFVIVVGISFYLIRKKLKYELWLAVHWLVYLAVLLAFGHQLKLGGDLLSNKLFAGYWLALYLFVLINLLFFRFMRPFWNYYRFACKVDRIERETPDTVSVYIRGKELEKMGLQAGQFLSLRFLCRGFWLQAHPFSVSRLPEHDLFRITVKNLGDYTAKIPQLKAGTKVMIEGPFGTFTAPRTGKHKYLFIAGGVGITPILPLIKETAAGNDVVLLYGCRNLHDIIFYDELEEMKKKQPFGLHIVLSNDQSTRHEKGRIDEEKLKRLVPDAVSREVYLCGPPAMIKTLLKTLADRGLPAGQIHYEKFSF